MLAGIAKRTQSILRLSTYLHPSAPDPPPESSLTPALCLPTILEALLLHTHLRHSPHMSPTRAPTLYNLATLYLHRLSTRPHLGPGWLFKRALDPHLLRMLCSNDAYRSIQRCYELLCGGRKLPTAAAATSRPRARSRSRAPSKTKTGTKPRREVGARVILVARFLRESGLLPRVVSRAVDATMADSDQ